MGMTVWVVPWEMHQAINAEMFQQDKVFVFLLFDQLFKLLFIRYTSVLTKNIFQQVVSTQIFSDFQFP